MKINPKSIIRNYPNFFSNDRFGVMLESYLVSLPCPLVLLFCCHIIIDFDLAAKV